MKLANPIFRLKTLPLSVIFLAALMSNAAFSQTVAKAKQTPKFSSVYTDLARDCHSALTREEKREAESRGQDVPLSCKGFGGYRLMISFSAIEEYLSVEKNSDEDASILLRPRDSKFIERSGEMVEWRLADGKLFAVIVRFSHFRLDGGTQTFTSLYDAKNKAGESLIVVGLPGFENIYFEVDAKTPEANRKAREMADNALLNMMKTVRGQK